jgi:HK97 family phage major capsid protein
MKKQSNLLLEALDNLMYGRPQSRQILSMISDARDNIAEILPSATWDEKNTIVWPVRGNILTDTPPAATIGQGTSDYFVPPITPRRVLGQIGITSLTSMADLRIPNSSAFTSAWKSEGSDADDGAGTVSSVSFKSLNVTSFVDISKQLPVQSPQVLEWVIDAMQASKDVAIESAIFGLAARSAIQPQGMLYKITSGSTTASNAVTPTMTNILELQKQVADAKCFSGNLGYLTSPKGMRILRKAQRESGLDSYLMENDNLLCGYPVYVSDQISDACGADTLGSGLIFGRWSDLCMVNFGAVLITINPYTLARYGLLRIVLNSYLDIKGLQGSASTGIGTDADEYALSFASLAIKA